MIIMADSTCLIGLARINKLEILKSLFGEIDIPEAVYREIVEKGEGKAGALEIEQANWIIRHKVEDKLAVKLLEKALEPGEAEVIVLAQELRADYVIIDDREGLKS